MRICLITEGSYPNILGGVSSWIDTFIKNCNEHEFIIFSIGADSSKRGQYKYDIPSNVIEIQEIFLDEMKLDNGEKGKRYRFKEEHKEALQKLLDGEEFQWENIFNFVKEKNFNNINEFFMSKDFYDLVKETYRKKYPYTPFTEFLWTIRSMYTILFYLLMNKFPKADIYHSVCTGYAGVLGSFGKYLYGSPLIISEHGIYTREREEEVIKSSWIKVYHKELWIDFFINLSRCAYDYADEVTSLFYVNRELQIELGCEENKTIIIPNGVDMEGFRNLLQKEESKYVNIGSIARVVPIKDIKTMIFSFELVKKEIPNARFYIMGPIDEDEEYYNECINIIKNYNIEDVNFTGSINVKNYIGKMDILVLTSISEGQPLAVMEGMAAKKPYVCTNVGDCKGLLYGYDDYYGKCGFIEYVMDYTGIAQSIIKLCKDEKLRKEMGENGYNRVENLYTKEGMLKQYKNLFKKYERG